MLTSSGGILFYGNATIAGHPKGTGNVAFVDLAPTPSGKGYWVVDANGKVYAFGDARKLGGLDAVKGWKGPIVGIVANPSAQGYSILAADGTVGGFGAAPVQGGRAKAGAGAVTQAAAPAHLIEGALPTEALLAHVLVAKYADYLPLYRQAQIYARAGLELGRGVLADWVGKAAFHLRPVVDCLASQLKASGKLFMDETRAPVLDPGRGATKTGYLWALARDDRRWGGADPPGIVYFYAPGRGAQHAEAMLAGFTGVLQVDGYAVYKTLAGKRSADAPLMLAHCWAHGRRELRALFDQDASPIAEEGLRRIAELYRIEALIVGQSPERRRAVRQERTKPLVLAFAAWLAEARSKLSRKSRAGEKLAYFAHHWQGLQLFLDDGRVEIDPNPVENRIRPLVLTQERAVRRPRRGRQERGRIASLLETAKMNGVDPSRLPDRHPRGDRPRPPEQPPPRAPALGRQASVKLNDIGGPESAYA